MRGRIRLLLFGLALTAAEPAPASVFTVTDPGNGGPGTLRQAILDANGNVGVVDSIEFALPGPSFTIQPTAALPAITDPVLIDGYTQSGAAPNTDPRGSNAILRVELDGSLAGDCDGLLIEHTTNLGAGTTIRGLVINRFASNLRAGIRINDDGNNRIEGNFIGTDVAGLAAAGNSDGISTALLAAGNAIGGQAPAARNLISGNANRGVVLDSNDNAVEGNLIGTNRSGTVALPNGAGIVLLAFAADNVIGGGVSFLSPAANTIAGNASGGIIIGSGSLGHDILSNRIGVGADGLTPLGNGGVSGVLVSADGTTIRDNTIAGNAGGIALGAVSNTVIQRNVIGLPQLGNSGVCVAIVDGNDNLVGGDLPDGNVIAGNGAAGVQVVRFMGAADGNAIRQNQIYANAGLGIELLNGANNGQPAPHLTGASDGTLVQGSLTAAPTTSYRLEIFANTVCAAGGGQGEVPIGVVDAVTDGAGLLQFDVSVGAYAGRPIVTATATDPLGNTSQFSNCVLNADALPRPSPALAPGALLAGLLLLAAVARRTLRRRRV